MKRSIEYFHFDTYTLEYSVIGEGEPILIFHGGHSNAREEFGYEPLLKSGYKIITPSRPGYGASSKELGNLSQASNAYKELLDYLNITKVHVIAVSAGGPSGIHFSSTYPEYVQTLSLQSAVTKKWITKKDPLYHMAKILFNPRTEKFTWAMLRIMNNRFPIFIFNQMAPQFTTLTKKQLKSMITDHDINEVKRMNNRQRSNNGFIIDINLPNQLRSELHRKIKAPTLIIHSKNDGSVNLSHPQYALKHISNAELKLFPTWGHLIWIGKNANEVHHTQLHFLTTHSIKLKSAE